MAEQRRVIFDFLGRDNLSRTLDHLGRRLEDLDGRFESSSRGMLSLGAAGTALAGPVMAAGAAFVGFAAVAAPAIGKVVSAQQNLAESWATLDEQQRASALQIKGLTDGFEDLAQSYQPQALAAFNTVLGAVKGQLPTVDKLVEASAGSMQGFADEVAGFVSGPMHDFLGFAADMGPRALNTLGSSMTTTGELALTLIQDTAPLGLSLLQVANGGLGMANSLAQANPALTQLAIGTLLLRGPIGAVAGGVTNMGNRMRTAAGAGQGLSRAARAANLAAAAGPALWITAGAAVGYFAIKAFTAKDASDKLVATLRAESGAVGNNIEGYQVLLSQVLPRLAEAKKKLDETAPIDIQNVVNTTRINELKDQISALEDEADKAKEALTKVETASDLLASKFGITKSEALQLANAAGVDLSKALEKNGTLTADATGKIQQYRMAVEQAKDPTKLVALALEDASNEALSMKDRMNALAVATDAVFTPALNAFNASTQLKDGFARLGEQLVKAKGRMDGATEASIGLRQAFGTQLSTLNSLYDATFQQTRSTDAASKAIRNQLPVLMAMTGGNRDAMRAVEGLAAKTGDVSNATNISRRSFLNAADAMQISRKRALELWDTLKDLKSKSISLSVNAKGNYNWGGGSRTSMGGGGHPLAVGGPVPALGPNASRAHDSVPAMLRVDEHVWTPEEVDKVGGHDAMYRLRAAARRGMLQGYAAGGAVGSLSASARISRGESIRPITGMINDGTTAMLTYMARVLAESFKRAASGGGVVAAARRWIGTPYSWGGGGPGGPSLGIGRGAGTVGFDCSGLTEYAWWKGRGVRIGGTTYEQHPRSSPVARRPGALGFPHMGHVVIASDKPGYVIEAPFTGGFVREVPKSMSDWRWPSGAQYGVGGKVRKWGQDFAGGYAVGGDRVLMEMAGIAGGRARARGGPVAPGVPYLVGEYAPEVFVPNTGGRIASPGGAVVHNHYWTVNVPATANPAEVGREVVQAVQEYEKRNGDGWRRTT